MNANFEERVPKTIYINALRRVYVYLLLAIGWINRETVPLPAGVEVIPDRVQAPEHLSFVLLLLAISERAALGQRSYDGTLNVVHLHYECRCVFCTFVMEVDTIKGTLLVHTSCHDQLSYG